MTQIEFCLLTQEEQIEAIYCDGAYIGKLKAGGRTIVLYQLDAFYVEITYKKYRFFIAEIRTFISTDKLTPYLPQIDVEGVIKFVG